MTSTTNMLAGVTIRSATDADWPALLAATCFGSFRDPQVTAMWRSMMATDGVVVATAGQSSPRQD